MRSAMHAASQLPGKGPTDVDDALHLHVIKNLIMMIRCDHYSCIFPDSATQNLIENTAKILKYNCLHIKDLYTKWPWLVNFLRSQFRHNVITHTMFS